MKFVCLRRVDLGRQLELDSGSQREQALQLDCGPSVAWRRDTCLEKDKWRSPKAVGRNAEKMRR